MSTLMRRFGTFGTALLMAFVIGMPMFTAPASAVQTCPTGYGKLCFWNLSYFLGNRYVADHIQRGFRLGPYWNDRFFSAQNTGVVRWIGYWGNHCQGDGIYLNANTNYRNLAGQHYVGSVSPVGYRGVYCP